MGGKLQRIKNTHQRDFPTQHTDAQDVWEGQTGTAGNLKLFNNPLGKVLGKTLSHFFPSFPRWLHNLPDPRDQNKITYIKETLLWGALFMFLAHSGSRRQYNNEKKESTAWRLNLSRLSGQKLETVPHGDTIDGLLRRLPHDELASLPCRMVKRLIRMKALDRFRLFGYLLLAIDGTGYLTYFHRHCDHCLTKTIHGKTIYYHHVLDAKVVTPSGLALSVATEFIENPSKNVTKQDCELKAFYRLVEKIGKLFPQLRICLLLDGLYAGQHVFGLCENHQWKHIITFKKGSMPATFDEFERLKTLEPQNKITWRKDGKKQIFSWVNDIEYHNYHLNVLECIERGKDKETRFVWLTNFDLDKDNVKHIANKGGRQRWKIENQGFNIQKNAGMEMEHAFSDNHEAAKNYYTLLQAAHTLVQLMKHGLLAKNFTQTWGSFRNFTLKIPEALRTTLIPQETLHPNGDKLFQIRLDSS